MQKPYSIFIDKRPLKIAFLIDPNKTPQSKIFEIINYNIRKWGGRYNPIIHTNGECIDDVWWKFLCNYDPDIIKSLIPLNDELILRIDQFLSPYLVEVPNKQELEDQNYHLHLYDEGVSVNTTIQHIRDSSLMYLENPTIAVFEINSNESDYYKNFFECNFGNLNINYSIGPVALNIEEFKINNKKELVDTLLELASLKNYIFPIHLCSSPIFNEDIINDLKDEEFTVIIGDSIYDITYYWNRVFSLPDWMRKYFKQLWIPTSFATDPELQEALKTLLQKMYRSYSNDRNNHIRFVSHSVEESQLTKIISNLIKSNIRKSYSILKKPPEIEFKEDPLLLKLRKNMEMYRANGKNDKIVLNNIISNSLNLGCWIIDVYMEYIPEKYNSVKDQQWWQLPKANRLALNIFSKPSRINKNRIPSILMRTNDSVLTINLPSSEAIIRTLILYNNTPCYTMDARYNLTERMKRDFYHVRSSDKGQYLNGLIEVFSNLYSAYDFLKENYWRRVFELFSNKDPKANIRERDTVKNKLSKKISGNIQKIGQKNDELEWLAGYVLQLSKQVTTREHPYKMFIVEAEKELQEYNSLKSDNKETIDEAGLEDSLLTLVENNILLMGIRPHCPNCGTAIWYQVDELKQILRCKGCTNSFTINPKEQWYYRLNTLVQMSFQQGIIPIILCLGQMYSFESRNTFIFDVSLEILNKSEQLIAELDIVCIVDGKFIIGEIKNSVSLYKKTDFDKMAEMAEIIRPDIVLFSSLDKRPTKTVIGHIESIRERLNPLGIDVYWHQLYNSYFEASPI